MYRSEVYYFRNQICALRTCDPWLNYCPFRYFRRISNVMFDAVCLFVCGVCVEWPNKRAVNPSVVRKCAQNKIEIGTITTATGQHAHTNIRAIRIHRRADTQIYTQFHRTQPNDFLCFFSSLFFFFAFRFYNDTPLVLLPLLLLFRILSSLLLLLFCLGAVARLVYIHSFSIRLLFASIVLLSAFLKATDLVNEGPPKALRVSRAHTHTLPANKGKPTKASQQRARRVPIAASKLICMRL